MSENKIKFIECPRDAMQGWPHIIPTEKKIHYINALMKVGFDTIDFGSFVSPKAIPQMADTLAVLEGIKPAGSNTNLLSIVANERGAKEAVSHEKINFLGYPFSLSETFQQRNTNASIADSFNLLQTIQNLCKKNNKELVVYLSMGFGNPYGDVYNEEIVLDWVNKLIGLDIKILSLADTVGIASAQQVGSITKYLVEAFPKTEIGVHLHSTPENWEEKAAAALNAGCRRFDGALKGIGGCPMAGNELVGNMNSESMLAFFQQQGLMKEINEEALSQCLTMAEEIFI